MDNGEFDVELRELARKFVRAESQRDIHIKKGKELQFRLERYRHAIRSFLEADGRFNLSTMENACTEDTKTCNKLDGTDCVLNATQCLFFADREGL